MNDYAAEFTVVSESHEVRDSHRREFSEEQVRAVQDILKSWMSGMAEQDIDPVDAADICDLFNGAADGADPEDPPRMLSAMRGLARGQYTDKANFAEVESGGNVSTAHSCLWPLAALVCGMAPRRVAVSTNSQREPHLNRLARVLPDDDLFTRLIESARARLAKKISLDQKESGDLEPSTGTELSINDDSQAEISKALGERILPRGGLYAYTYSAYYPHRDGRKFIKVGRASGDPNQRIMDQYNQAGRSNTAVPERPLPLAIYTLPEGQTGDLRKLEKSFHAVLEAFETKAPGGHHRSEWFVATLEQANAIAEALGLEADTGASLDSEESAK